MYVDEFLDVSPSNLFITVIKEHNNKIIKMAYAEDLKDIDELQSKTIAIIYGIGKNHVAIKII